MVRLRRPRLPHLGHGAFLGAQWTGITIGVGASVPMACISGVEVGKYPHSPGCRPYLSRAKRLGTTARLVGFGEKCQNDGSEAGTKSSTDNLIRTENQRGRVLFFGECQI